MSDYPSNMTLRPIETWPGAETRSRERSAFKSPWRATLQLLDRELFALGPGRYYPKAILQIAMRECDFRNDGMPRANAAPAHPGVIVNVESTKGPLSFPCDKFDRWQDNIRAVALGLEALRKIDRYGITPGDEQYRGWQAIEAPKPASTFTAETAEAFLRGLYPNEGDGLDLGTIPQVFRRVRGLAHPDRNDGRRTTWDLVEAAAGALRAAGSLP